MSNLKTNITHGNSSDRTKNLENITIMATANQNLQLNKNTKTNTLVFTDNKLTSANNHTNLLKATHGYYSLQPCCDLPKKKSNIS